MSTSRIYLCAIPADVWEQPAAVHGKHVDIAQFVADALGCEQRIAKQVNLENEYSRYTLCCQRIEQEIGASQRLAPFKTVDDFRALLQKGRFPVVVVNADLLDALDCTLDEPGPERLGASFFPPSSVAAHRAAFSEWSKHHDVSNLPCIQHRLAFLRLAESTGCGIIELQSAYHLGNASQPAAVGAARRVGDESEAHYVVIPEFMHTGLVTEAFGQRKQKLTAILRQHIREALMSREPVAFGNEAQHDVITEVLNEFVFVPRGNPVQPLQLRVVYADGSEASPFPLGSLPYTERSVGDQQIRPLRVALMSMRHLELDPEIDFCWFRNRDVSRTRTLAETDRFCFDTTLSQLRDSLALGDLVLHLYHTGFEPAVLGFYRGVIHTLHELRAQRSPRRLIVVPFYYRGGTNYQAGTPWQ